MASERKTVDPNRFEVDPRQQTLRDALRRTYPALRDVDQPAKTGAPR